MNSYFYLATLLALCIVPIVHLESVETPTEDAVKGDTPVIVTEEVEEEVVVVDETVEEAVSCDATVETCDAVPVKIDVEKDPGMFKAILKFLHLI